MIFDQEIVNIDALKSGGKSRDSKELDRVVGMNPACGAESLQEFVTMTGQIFKVSGGLTDVSHWTEKLMYSHSFIHYIDNSIR